MHLTPAFYVPRKLDHNEIASRRAELRSLIHQTRWPRRALYLLNCQLCQCFWMALLVLAISLIVQNQSTTAYRMADLFLSAVSYAVVIATVSGWRPWKKKQLAAGENRPTSGQRPSDGCGGGCGGNPRRTD